VKQSTPKKKVTAPKLGEEKDVISKDGDRNGLVKRSNYL